VLADKTALDTMAAYRKALEDQRHVSTTSPRGRLTFSGIVLESSPERLLLKLRSGSAVPSDYATTLVSPTTASAPTPRCSEVNARVFVRAGEGIDGVKLEVYQVIRGTILSTR
jgi:hypothetical protein